MFIQDIARNTISANYRSFLGNEGVNDFINIGGSNQYIYENIENCDVLLLSEAIVGFAVCKGDLIDLMMISDGFHRQGFGRQLLKYCENRIFRKHSEIRLESFEGNEKANNFYRKNGWNEAGLNFDETSGTNKITFVKKKKGT